MNFKSSGGSGRSPFLVRAVRTRPHLYSAVCKARIFYSRRIAAAQMRRLFKRNRSLFTMSELEAQQVKSLRESGYALISEFFPREQIDRIF
jgi:hypothetical protein